MYFFSKQTPSTKLSELASRKTLAYSEKSTMCEFTLEKGAQIPPHTHVHEQSSYIVKGSLEFDVDGEKAIVNQGDSVFIPSNSPHSVICLEPAIVLEVFTPIRKEYL